MSDKTTIAILVEGLLPLITPIIHKVLTQSSQGHGKEGRRYRNEVVKLFESWLKRIDGFREEVNKRNEIQERMRAESFVW